MFTFMRVCAVIFVMFGHVRPSYVPRRHLPGLGRPQCATQGVKPPAGQIFCGSVFVVVEKIPQFYEVL